MAEQEGEQSELSPREDAGGLLTRRLTELAKERGSEAAEQTRQEKATEIPLPKELILFRRLGEISQDVAGRDEHTRRDFAIMQYACGWAILGDLIRQDAELTVIINRQKGRPDTELLVGSDAQAEVAWELENQRRGLEEQFPTVDELPLSPRQQQLVADVVGRVAISQPQPMETVSLDRKSLQWPSLVAQEAAEATLAAADPDLVAHHRRVIVKDAPGRITGTGKPPPNRQRPT